MKQNDDDRPAPSLARDAAYENSFKTIYPSAKATGLRPHGLRYRAQNQLRETNVAEEFLVNSRIRRFDREFGLSAQGFYYGAPALMSSLVGHESCGDEARIELSEPIALKMEIGQAMRRRRSKRDYSGEKLGFDEFSTLIWSAAGVTGRGEVSHLRGGRTSIYFRTTPSGGALYSIELYVAALNVDRVPIGLYRHEAISGNVVEVGGSSTIDRLLATFCVNDDQISLSRASSIFLLIARPWRAMRKYGPRGLRHVFIEAGSMAQNVHLACVALGLSSVDCSSVYDDEAHEALGVDGLYETLVHVVVIGDPGGAA
jgi:SagB-type dehydrogenase family enzyme